jgi:hypothetical protein
MEQLSNFSFDSAFVFLIKIIFTVVSLGLLGFVFLILRQVQSMNKVLSTQLAPVFVVVSLFLLLGGIGLFCLVLISFLA